MVAQMGENYGEISLKDQVYTSLKNDIILGHLRPGDTLSMLELCKRFDTSGAPVREALNVLSTEGLVNLPPHKRPVVSSIEEEDIETIAFLRNVLEPYAAHLSVGKIPQEKIDGLRRDLMEVLEHPEDRDRYVRSDLALHELLHQYAGSPLLSEIMGNVKDRSIRLRYIQEEYHSQYAESRNGIVIATTLEHLQILDALEGKDWALVGVRVQQHLKNYSERAHMHQRGNSPKTHA